MGYHRVRNPEMASGRRFFRGQACGTTTSQGGVRSNRHRTVLIPFLLGIVLFTTTPNRHFRTSAVLGSDTKDQKAELSLSLNELELEWTFFADWQYKPLLFPADDYLVFVFHYTNHSDFPMYVTPTYTLECKPGIRYAANEEIAAYVEDAVETELGVTDETPINV